MRKRAVEDCTGISFRLWGRNALFTDPIMKLGGEKCSYHLPTYEAIKGVLESIYWKPTFIWVVDSVRVMKPIRTEARGMKLRTYTAKSELSYYTYLCDVEYQVKAHMEWNEQRPDLECDRDYKKHYTIANRYLNRGGKRSIFLGTSDCFGFVEPCEFGSGVGFYDEIPELSYGVMYHGIDYPTHTGKAKMEIRLAPVAMKNGVIQYARPSECLHRVARKMPVLHVACSSVDEEEKWFGGAEDELVD